jgi:hypothetical protein
MMPSGAPPQLAAKYDACRNVSKEKYWYSTARLLFC